MNQGVKRTRELEEDVAASASVEVDGGGLSLPVAAPSTQGELDVPVHCSLRVDVVLLCHDNAIDAELTSRALADAPRRPLRESGSGPRRKLEHPTDADDDHDSTGLGAAGAGAGGVLAWCSCLSR